MPLILDATPGEILGSIVDHLDNHRDIIRFSSACKSMRQRLAHRVFHTIRFSNDARISDSALLAVHAHGSHVKVLRFVGYASKEDDSDVDGSQFWAFNPSVKDGGFGSDYSDEFRSDNDSDRDPDDNEPNDDADANEISQPPSPERPKDRDQLPPSAVTLFEASEWLLPNLETFSINFDHDYGEASEFSAHGAIFFMNHESWAQVRMREMCMTMCRLWANAYKALATGTAGPGWRTAPLPGLAMENWSPRGVTTFKTPEWKTYLSKLENFSIQVIAETLGWNCTNSMRGYVEDFANTQDFFFAHLSAVKTCKISLNWLGALTPFGMRGEGHLPLPMKISAETMPVLEHLELSNVFISSDLAGFIISHKKTLRTVILHDAHSAAAEYGECAEDRYKLSWAEFFEKLSAALDNHQRNGGLALTEFTSETVAPLSETEAKTGKFRYKSEKPAIKKVRDDMVNDPERRLFGYGDLGEENGKFIHDVRTNQASAISGKDQEAYVLFRTKLAENRERLRLLGHKEPGRAAVREEHPAAVVNENLRAKVNALQFIPGEDLFGSRPSSKLAASSAAARQAAVEGETSKPARKRAPRTKVGDEAALPTRRSSRLTKKDAE
ncbi:hypothetical protein QBC35DRAFT_507929 [Podospora australis]|uniref:F-box domain-containing protein n=1 Tax=Podospora australis TaxID=1536484 RepID=A0AAN6WJZ1_9PEZI|nr:hypothetical protein QBC35DRAFT_507929 [Podospora australis]